MAAAADSAAAAASGLLASGAAAAAVVLLLLRSETCVFSLPFRLSSAFLALADLFLAASWAETAAALLGAGSCLGLAGKKMRTQKHLLF